MSSQLKDILKYTVFLGLGIALLYLAFGNQDIPKLLADMRSAKYEWVILALFFGVLSHVFRAARWVLLVEPMGYKTSTLHSFYGVMIGYLVNLAVPRAGEVSRCAAMNRLDKVPVNVSLGTVVLERLIDMIMLVILLLLTFFLQAGLIGDFMQREILGPLGDKAGKLIILGVIALVMLGLAIFVFWKFSERLLQVKFIAKLVSVLGGFAEGLRSVLKVKKQFLFWTYTLGIWVCYYLVTYVCFFAVEPTSELSPLAGLTVLAIGTIGMTLPSPGGIGAFEYFVKLSLWLYAIPETDALTYATINHSAQILMFFVVGGVSFIMVTLAERKRKRNELEAANQ